MLNYSQNPQTEEGDFVQERIQAYEDKDALTSLRPSLQLSDESQTFMLQLQEIIKMKNLKPTTIKIYDYYQPEERALVAYSAVCS
ncbi:hypothetical protein ASZ78_002128 [Callipepla squamata]|uniref:Alpha-macroglobulin receptor-binding domain-containing protein n=1 Tax=Callipepla squamata TaxID=9009 RepID=A0A226MLY6_CALSU|nr:hypothetical protein ASZ78_002128 [Callipepla squamata]